MIHHRFSVLHEPLLRHVPRRDIFVRLLVDLRIQVHTPSRAHDLVSWVEREPTQLGRLHDGPDRHDGSSETQGLLNCRA